MIPNGYSNSLHWNLGHIAAAQEGIMHCFGMNQAGDISPQIQAAFKAGTSPNDWSAPPLTLYEIRELLLEQKARMIETFSGSLGEPAANVFAFKDTKLTRVGDLFIFTL